MNTAREQQPGPRGLAGPAGPPGQPVIPPGFPGRWLALLLLVALVLRVGTALSRVDACFAEALLRGALAGALIDDAPVWPAQAPVMIHVRGSVVMSWIDVASYLLLGPTTFALQVPGMVFHLATLVTLMLLVYRQLGRLACVLGGALLVLAPPGYAAISVLSYGDHVESLPFIFATALFALAWAEDGGGRRYATAFGAGVCAGLGFAFHAQSRLGVMIVGGVCLLGAPRLPLRRDFWLAFLPGLALGLVPHFIGDWITSQNALLVLGGGPAQILRDGLSGAWLAKWGRFWISDLPDSLQYRWPPLGAVLVGIAALCAAGLAVSVVRRLLARTLGLRALLFSSGVFVAYALGFSLVYALSPYEIEHGLENAVQVRYVLPVVPVVLLPIAVAAARLAERGRRAAAALLAGPALALGLYGSLSTWDLDTILHEPARKGMVWEQWTQHFAWGSLSDEERAELRALEVATRDDPGQDRKVHQFVMSRVDSKAVLEMVQQHDDGEPWTRPLRFPVPLRLSTKGTEPQQLVQRLRGQPPELRPYAAVSLARELAQERNLRVAHANALLLAGESPEETVLLARGFGMSLPGMSLLLAAFDGRLANRRLELLDPAVDRREIAFGLGLQTGTLASAFYAPGWRLIAQVLEHFPKELHSAFARGVGSGYRRRFLEPPPRDIDTPAVRWLLTLFPPELESDLRDGLGGSPSAQRTG